MTYVLLNGILLVYTLFNLFSMNEDKVIEMLLENREDIQYLKEQMTSLTTKVDGLGNVSDGIQEILKLSRKRDEETTMITHGMRRHEDRLDGHDTDIKRIQTLVGAV